MIRITTISVCLFFQLSLKAQGTLYPLEVQEELSELPLENWIRDSVSRISLVRLIPYPSPNAGYYRAKSVIREGGIDTSHINYIMDLDPSKWNEFTNIINCPLTNSWAACYDPRHGILFFNQGGEIISYLELCFECSVADQIGYQLYLRDFNLSSEQFEELKKLFISVGVEMPEINYGDE